MSITVVAAVAAVAAILAFIALAYWRRWAWTGFVMVDGGTERRRTLWDWLGLFVIPLALAAIGFVLTTAQTERENRRDDRRAKLDRELADARAAADRARAADQAREEVLRAYLGQMSDLLLDRDLRRSPAGSATRTLAHTLTLSVLPRLDGRRKGVVLRFIDEAGLIRTGAPKIQLWGADLRNATLDHASLDRPALQRADLRNASFRSSLLYSASFASADLRGADFTGSILDSPVFFSACLSGVSFRGASLNGPDFDFAMGRDIDFGDEGYPAARMAKRAGTDRAAEDQHCTYQAAPSAVG